MKHHQQFNQRVFNRSQPDSLAMRRIKQIHFVGIGGAGMGGIAEVLLTQGFNVSGSDVSKGVMTSRLEKLGAKIHIGHHANQVLDADVVVSSSAINQDNPELVMAHKKRIPVVPRAEMLAELMRFRYGVAVAGTHGKTTTTSLLTSLLAQGGLDPTFVIGGLLHSAGANARLGASPYLVAEADESDGSFLLLSPMVTIITNIDRDHLGTYENSFEKLKSTFIDFTHRLPFYGLVIACLDCPTVREIVSQIARPIMTYGFHKDAYYKITQFEQKETRSHFVIESKKLKEPLHCELNLPGRHNVLNATAGIIVALEEGVEPSAIRAALKEFSGIGRRFNVYQVKDMKNEFLLVDDYGHHPAEIKATLDAARLAWPDKKINLAFQPHRYSRTHDLFEDFVDVLSCVDKLFLLEVFSAGEKPMVGADGRALSGAIRARGQVDPIFVPNPADLPQILSNHLQDGEVLITQGAGDIGKMAQQLAEHFQLYQQAS